MRSIANKAQEATTRSGMLVIPVARPSHDFDVRYGFEDHSLLECQDLGLRMDLSSAVSEPPNHHLVNDALEDRHRHQSHNLARPGYVDGAGAAGDAVHDDTGGLRDGYGAHVPGKAEGSDQWMLKGSPPRSGVDGVRVGNPTATSSGASS